MVSLLESQYRNRVLGAWLGKVIGATAGSASDGQKQAQESAGDPQALTDARPRPCDCFALELLSLRALAASGPHLTSEGLTAAWLRHLSVFRDEYGHAFANLRRGIDPPLSGVFDNPFREAPGAMARADLWGMLAPADPEAAAVLARQDAGLDHSGTGVEAAILVAALVSAAFAESDPGRLLELGLKFLPAESRVARAVRDIARWHGEFADWRRTREMLLRAYPSDDVRDSVVAAGLLALALLDGSQDLSRTVATAARCGWSAATVGGAAGAVIGAALGEEGIPQEWRGILPSHLDVAGTLVGLNTNPALSALVSDTCDLGCMVVRTHSIGRVELVEELPENAPSALEIPDTDEFLRQLSVGPYVTYRRRGDLGIYIDHDGPPTIGYGAPCRLTITIANLGAKRAAVSARISGPPGFVITIPGQTSGSEPLELSEGGSVSFSATIIAEEGQAAIAPANSFLLFISVETGPESVVPFTLIGEVMWYASGPYGDFDQAHPPESEAILSGQLPLGGEGWQSLPAPEPAVNLVGGLAGEKGTYYLASDVLAHRARRARLRVACNDGTKVWCNGQEVWQQHEHRPPDGRASGDEFSVELRQGWNRIVIKMAQCSPRRFLSVALKDLEGRLSPDFATCERRRQP